MKMTNAEMDEALIVLSEADEKGLLGYAITRNKRRIEDAAKEYLDLKYEALKKYGEKIDHNDGTFEYSLPLSKKGEVEKYFNELGEIPNIEHEVEIFTVPEKEFYSGSLTSKQMDKLLWMVE